MIQGIFYARFLPQEGTKVVAQSPPGCIVATEYAPHLKPPLVDFDIVQEYIIPRKAFFNRFVTVTTPDGEHSILGFPVSIPHERYHRNEFIFNFGLVIESDVDHIPYERLVRRFAVTFAEMERQNGYLSNEGQVNDGRRPIESLLEIVKEDLNNYGECMIPIVHGWHVPVPKTKLAEIVDSTWDLTLQRIIPHVDGVNDVRRIAWLADVSLDLTQCALQHLLYYDTILLLDMFFFGSCYALRPGVHDFIANRANIIDECAAYVWISSQEIGIEAMAGSTASLDIPGITSARHRSDLSSTTPRPHTATASRPTTSSMATSTPAKASHYQLIRLMTTFCVGRSTMEWVRLHQESGFDVLRHVDVRRLVQFGVVKGLLYRVHKYAISKSYLTLLATGRRPGIELSGGSSKRRTTDAMNDNNNKDNDKAKAKGKGRATRGDGMDSKSPEDDVGLEMKMTSRRISNLRIHDEVDNEEEEEDADNNDSTAEGAPDGSDEGDEGGDDDDDDNGDNSDDNNEDMAAKAAANAGKTRRKMQRYLDGRHPFDQIITEQNLTDAEILRKLKCFEPGDIAIMYR